MTPKPPTMDDARWREPRERAPRRSKGHSRDVSAMRKQDVKSLVHELEIHQAELEVQNEELRRAQLGLTETRDRYLDLYERAPVGYLILDAGGVIRRANLVASTLFARERADIIGSRIEILVAPEDTDACRLHLHGVAAMGETRSPELRFLRPDDSIFWALVETASAGQEGNAADDVYRMTIVDITGRKDIEERLQAQEERMRVAAEAARFGTYDADLVAGTLHWSPEMRAILGLPADAAAQAVDALLRETLEVSRSLTVELSPPVLHEAGLIGGLNWLASRMKEKNGFTVNLRSDNKAEPATEGMRFLLFECARELLFNAMKHSGVKEADVVVVRTKDDLIRLVVSDDGGGFDPELLERRTSEYETFGLFSIEQRLSHIGGRMEIVTAPGKGTRITLTAPAGGKESSTEEEARVAAEDGDGGKKIKMRRRSDVCRVLVVDDHEIVRKGLIGLFQFEADIDIVGEAADGPAAIELADELKPDVIVMDVNLGDMNGIEATRRILAKSPEIKIVGLSMHVDKTGLSEDLIAAVRSCYKGRI